MNILAIIPARMGSSRFPGKPMEKILGKPMIGHVYERVSQNPMLTKTIVATCDQIIFDYIQSIGGSAVMTKDTYERASDRCAEALIKTENAEKVSYDIVEFEDRNCIKVVCDINSNALYFSREPIPTRFKTNNIPMGKQVCIIPFRRNFLIEYTKLKPTPLEIAESIDMMRILEHQIKVRMIPTKYETFAVDTKEDLLKVEELMKKLNYSG